MNPTNISEHVSDLLGLLRVGLLAPPEAAGVRAHLDVCAQCTAELSRIEDFAIEWEACTAKDVAQTMPEIAEEHVPTEILWFLADNQTGPMPADFKNAMEHALNCRRCYSALADCRSTLLNTVDEEELATLAEESWDRLRSIHLQVLVGYIGALTTERFGRLRVGLGLPKRMRMLSDADRVPAEAADRDLGSAWEFERSFGDYLFKVVLIPRDFDKETVEIALKAERIPGYASESDLWAELSGDDGRVSSFAFVGGQAAFGSLPLRDYKICVTNVQTNTTVALIDISAGAPK